MLEIAKRAGFSLKETTVLLQSAQAGIPASQALHGLAARKLPAIEALIDRAQTMRAWMLAAGACGCTTLDVCALFDAEQLATEPAEPVARAT